MASVPGDFVVARNAEPGSTLPYLVRVPLGDGIILKAEDTWQGTGKVYCHRIDEWPDDAEVAERVAVRSCVRRGAAIDLVLDRGRENRSQIVITNARGRQMIFLADRPHSQAGASRGLAAGRPRQRETRKLAQEWTYRFLAAARVGLSEEVVGDLAVRLLEAAPPLAPAPPTPADVRPLGRTGRRRFLTV